MSSNDSILLVGQLEALRTTKHAPSATLKALGIASIVAGMLVLFAAFWTGQALALSAFWLIQTMWVIYYSMRHNGPSLRGAPFFAYVAGGAILATVGVGREFAEIPLPAFAGFAALCAALFAVMLGSLWRR